MLLSKEFAVYLNLAACKLKLYTAAMLKKKNIDLTPEQFLMIDLLWNNGAMSQQKVADMMQKDKNSITKLADALEKKGMLERKKDKSDLRSNILVLTPKAEDLKNEAKEKGISILESVLEGIEEEDVRTFLDTLARITDNMEKRL